MAQPRSSTGQQHLGVGATQIPPLAAPRLLPVIGFAVALTAQSYPRASCECCCAAVGHLGWPALLAALTGCVRAVHQAEPCLLLSRDTALLCSREVSGPSHRAVTAQQGGTRSLTLTLGNVFGLGQTWKKCARAERADASPSCQRHVCGWAAGVSPAVLLCGAPRAGCPPWLRAVLLEPKGSLAVRAPSVPRPHPDALFSLTDRSMSSSLSASQLHAVSMRDPLNRVLGKGGCSLLLKAGCELG